jgi:hypothetical protein
MKKAKEAFLVLLWGGVIFPAIAMIPFFLMLLAAWVLFNG